MQRFHANGRSYVIDIGDNEIENHLTARATPPPIQVPVEEEKKESEAIIVPVPRPVVGLPKIQV